MNPIFVALLLLSLPYQNMEVGICKMSTEKDFDIAANMVFEWHRGGVAWAGIEINLWGYPFYWKEADAIVNNSIGRGIKTLWTLAFTP